MTAVRATPAVTAPVEDYLKVIFELESAAGVAGTNEIAAELGFAPASVSGMVRRLAEQGLITHERYRGVKLDGGTTRGASDHSSPPRHRSVSHQGTWVPGGSCTR